MVPETTPGKIVGSLCSLSGVLVIAILCQLLYQISVGYIYKTKEQTNEKPTRYAIPFSVADPGEGP